MDEIFVIEIIICILEYSTSLEIRKIYKLMSKNSKKIICNYSIPKVIENAFSRYSICSIPFNNFNGVDPNEIIVGVIHSLNLHVFAKIHNDPRLNMYESLIDNFFKKLCKDCTDLHFFEFYYTRYKNTHSEYTRHRTKETSYSNGCLISKMIRGSNYKLLDYFLNTMQINPFYMVEQSNHILTKAIEKMDIKIIKIVFESGKLNAKNSGKEWHDAIKKLASLIINLSLIHI
jgi:hypothetical protein